MSMDGRHLISFKNKYALSPPCLLRLSHLPQRQSLKMWSLELPLPLKEEAGRRVAEQFTFHLCSWGAVL